MKQLKKRTIALVLASVVTVAGSFASTNYKNSLMGLSFDFTPSGINLNVETKTAYTDSINPIRKDSNTFVITLPEVNSNAGEPDLTNYSSNIQSVTIRTMPYSTNSNGYTRITIKTVTPVSNFTAKNKIFIPTKKEEERYIEQNPQVSQASEETKKYENELKRYKEELEQKTKELEKEREKAAQKQDSYKSTYNANKIVYVDSAPKKKKNNTTASTKSKITNSTANNKPAPIVEKEQPKDFNNYYLLLLALAIVIGSGYFVKKAFKNMDSLTGEKLQIDVDDDKNTIRKKKSRREQIKTTIKKLDTTYPKTATMPSKSEYTQDTVKEEIPEVIEEVTVVDLDEVFNEHIAQNTTTEIDDENQALEDFLSGFSFDEEFNQLNEHKEEAEEEITTYDEEYYEEIIKSKNLTFTNTDIECINKLLNLEISDNTLKNIKEYAVSNPIKKVPSKKELLEELVTTYAISQNINFDTEDIDTLNKLMSVELENDFITDLRTNPERTAEMQKEMEFLGDKLKKPSEIVMMSVKDLLPDLSDALKKQGNKKVESNYKPKTVYFSKGYDVSILKVDSNLPDLTTEIYNENSYKFKPTAEIQYVDNSYQVDTMDISFELPDLEDALANPDKYKSLEEPQKEIIDEETMLKAISNVEFKPFYDESMDIEILNDIPSVSDMQNEFKDFEDFEISEEEEIAPISQEQQNYNDFEAFFSNDYVDLDKEQEEATQKDGEIIKPKKETSEDLINKIIATKEERLARKERILKERTLNKKTSEEKTEKKTEEIKCILEEEAYTIISSTELTNNIGCHLAKNENGYVVLGYIGDKLFKIKNYSILHQEKIQSRHSEKISEDTSRYIVRIGMNKFILDVKGENIEFVMDLC